MDEIRSFFDALHREPTLAETLTLEDEIAEMVGDSLNFSLGARTSVEIVTVEELVVEFETACAALKTVSEYRIISELTYVLTLSGIIIAARALGLETIEKVKFHTVYEQTQIDVADFINNSI